jgi:hypothetical protein
MSQDLRERCPAQLSRCASPRAGRARTGGKLLLKGGAATMTFLSSPSKGFITLLMIPYAGSTYKGSNISRTIRASKVQVNRGEHLYGSFLSATGTMQGGRWVPWHKFNGRSGW